MLQLRSMDRHHVVVCVYICLSTDFWIAKDFTSSLSTLWQLVYVSRIHKKNNDHKPRTRIHIFRIYIYIYVVFSTYLYHRILVRISLSASMVTRVYETCTHQMYIYTDEVHTHTVLSFLYKQLQIAIHNLPEWCERRPKWISVGSSRHKLCEDANHTFHLMRIKCPKTMARIEK